MTSVDSNIPLTKSISYIDTVSVTHVIISNTLDTTISPDSELLDISDKPSTFSIAVTTSHELESSTIATGAESIATSTNIPDIGSIRSTAEVIETTVSFHLSDNEPSYSKISPISFDSLKISDSTYSSFSTSGATPSYEKGGATEGFTGSSSRKTFNVLALIVTVIALLFVV
ncbi:hypothetical protein B5S28_g5248 [[Candida] boidinii]|nr:hypothetical protein B5S28_g5248 [[Candida] boidinii]OWB73164.1 hypothetical protein B5S31_g2897 [[Candida] boidinii]